MYKIGLIPNSGWREPREQRSSWIEKCMLRKKSEIFLLTLKQHTGATLRRQKIVLARKE